MYRRQILAQLRLKFPGVSEKFLGLLADKIAKEVTEEAQIEGHVTELENSPISVSDLADMLQREGDRRVSEAKPKAPVTPGTPATPNPDGSAPVNDDASKTDIEKLTALVGQLTGTVQTLVKEKQTATISSQMEAKLKEKNIPSFMLKGRVPEKDEDVETVLSEIEADWSSQKQETANNGLGQQRKPVLSADGGTEGKVNPAIAKFTEKVVAAAAAKTK